MTAVALRRDAVETDRHRTAYLDAGPADGPLIVFLHGWPELSIIWRAQLEHFAAAGWRAVAPDLRGYGGSSAPDRTGDYAISEVVHDLVEFQDALGGKPAVWVGHDWGSVAMWSMVAHHPDRCRAAVGLSIPYFARGFALSNLLPLIDRELYPPAEYPVGQWDYFLYYREQFTRAVRAFEADPAATLAQLYRRATRPAQRHRSPFADIRAADGFFGPLDRAPTGGSQDLVPPEDFDTIVAAFEQTGFAGSCAWYLNDDANMAFASSAPNFGRLDLPVLFLDGRWDTTSDSTRSRFAEPMRADCANLTELAFDGGHELMVERPDEVNDAIDSWLATR